MGHFCRIIPVKGSTPLFLLQPIKRPIKLWQEFLPQTTDLSANNPKSASKFKQLNKPYIKQSWQRLRMVKLCDVWPFSYLSSEPIFIVALGTDACTPEEARPPQHYTESPLAAAQEVGWKTAAAEAAGDQKGSLIYFSIRKRCICWGAAWTSAAAAARLPLLPSVLGPGEEAEEEKESQGMYFFYFLLQLLCNTAACSSACLFHINRPSCLLVPHIWIYSKQRHFLCFLLSEAWALPKHLLACSSKQRHW